MIKVVNFKKFQKSLGLKLGDDRDDGQDFGDDDDDDDI
jgi:hypothetical protein